LIDLGIELLTAGFSGWATTGIFGDGSVGGLVIESQPASPRAAKTMTAEEVTAARAPLNLSIIIPLDGYEQDLNVVRTPKSRRRHARSHPRDEAVDD
jgi:hypothetical protein